MGFMQIELATHRSKYILKYILTPQKKVTKEPIAMAQAQPQRSAVVTINSQVRSPMSLDRSENWSGAPVGSFPSTIAANGRAEFVHNVGPQFGSMAAVQYSVTNAGVSSAFILAWDAPRQYSQVTPNRVFALFGTKQDIDRVSWDEVFRALSRAPDSITGPVTATIRHANNTANLVASVRLPN